MGLNIQGSNSDSGVVNRNFKYDYPFGMDLRPGSRTHTKIVNKVMNSARASWDVMSQRHPEWRLMDKMLTAYIKTSDYEKSVKKADPNKPVSIVVPYQYAVMETILSYKTKAFLMANPIFEYDGFGPEDTISAKLLELVIDQQVRRLKSPLAIHTGFRNGLAYGIGASPVTWAEKWGRKPVVKDASTYSASGQLLEQKTITENEPTLLFEGNKIGAIDPYRYLPDPNYSPHQIQDGEFVGWIDEDSYLNLLADEGRGSLFNVKFLRDRNFIDRASMFDSSDARSKGGTQQKDNTGATRPVTLVNMYHTIVPRELGIPGTAPGNIDGDYPEKWTFTIANDCICIWAHPSELNHDMYPVAVNAPDFDGYTVSPISRLELDHGLQEVLNWMFNSHVANVRKAMNDMLIVDPSLINMEDLKNPEPGKLLRLRRAAWGRGVKDAVHQLAVNDVTRQNIPDAMNIMDLMQRTTGSVDSVMGIMRSSGERKSAAEFTGTFNSAISRLEHMGWITSWMYLNDLAYLQGSHTQQMMSKEVYVKAIGDWPQVLMEEYGEDALKSGKQVSPYDLMADFDIVYKDGASASTDSMSAQFWTETMTVLAQNPELNTVFDLPRIFSHVARLKGAKDVRAFIRKGGSMQAQLVGQNAMMAELQKGNIIPADEGATV